MVRPLDSVTQQIRYASYGSPDTDPTGTQPKSDQYQFQDGDTVSEFATALQQNFGLSKSIPDIEHDLVTQMQADPNNRAHTTLDPNKPLSWDLIYAGDSFDLGSFWQTETKQTAQTAYNSHNSFGYQAAVQFAQNGPTQNTQYTDGHNNIQNAVDFVSYFDQDHDGFMNLDETNKMLGLPAGTQNTIAMITKGKSTDKVSVHDATLAFLNEDRLETVKTPLESNPTATDKTPVEPNGTVTTSERQKLLTLSQTAASDSNNPQSQYDDTFYNNCIASLENQNTTVSKKTLGGMIDDDYNKDIGKA